MSEDKAKGVVPPLRFPEFRDAGLWVIKKIGDYFDVRSSKRVLQKDWQEEGVPFYRTRELVALSKNEPFNSKVYISEELFLELANKYGLPEEGDFLVSGVGTLGIAYQVKAGDRFYFKDGNVLWLHRKSGINSTFFLYSFGTTFVQKQIKGGASVSTVGTYTIEKARKTSFACPPTKEEQQKIADCLSSLDDLIRAEGERLEALKEHKKGLMQWLFPREGQTTPDLRFPEFRDAGPWEVKRLGEIVRELIDGDWIETKDQSNSGIRLIQTGNVGIGEFIQKIEKSRYISYETFVRLNCKEVFPGDCLVSRLPDPIGRACLVPYIGSRMITAVDCAIVRFDKDLALPNYFIQYSQTPEYFCEVEAYASGSTRKRISRDNLARVKIPLPSLPEQQKIADCLSSLDDLIRAQEARIEVLKLHKKGLMQQLFPQEVQ